MPGPTKPTYAARDHQNGGLRLYKTEKRIFGVQNDPGLPKNVVRYGEAMSFDYRRVSYNRPRFKIFAKSPHLVLKTRRRSAKKKGATGELPRGHPS